MTEASVRDDAIPAPVRATVAAGEANGTRSRISANSFRLLTERLKSKSAAAPVMIPEFVVPVAIPAAVLVEVVQETTLDPMVETPAAETVLAEPVAADETANLVAEFFEAEAEIESPASSFALPSFEPLTSFQPGPVVEPVGHDAEPVVVEAEAAEELEDQRPEWALAPLEPEALAEPESEPELEAAFFEPHPEPADVLDTQEFAAPEELTEPAAEELVEELQPVPEDIIEAVAETEPELLAETSEPAADLELSEPELLVTDAPEQIVVEALVEAPVSPEVAKESDAPGSQLAGRVVEAIIKTISEAVYAKPSAADRAAFLKEMAVLMEAESAATAAEPAPQIAETPTPAAFIEPSQPAPVPAVEARVPDIEIAAELPEPIVAAIVTDAAPVAEEAKLSEVLAQRIGNAAALKRSPVADADPFAKLALTPPPPAETIEADETSGELALSLLDMMSAGAASGLPQERALAADTLLRILPRIPVKPLLAVVERVAIMESPPALLVAKLIRDPRPEVVAPLLERCMHITDQDLIAAAVEGDTGKQRMIARRRVLSPVLADQLIALGDPSVVLTLIRNPGASFSHDAFYALAEIASRHHSLLAPLTTRADLPPPVAFELFWYVPPELRRFIFSRFLTDSETLNKILRITLATYSGEGEQPGVDNKFPPREVIDTALNLAAEFRLDEAAQVLAEHGGVCRETALRILADREGEPMAVILKSMGYQRGRFTEAIERLQKAENAIVRPDRMVEDLQNIFDSLSFNKARILLTYWDWYVRKSGPYAPRN